MIHCIGDSHVSFFSGYDEIQPEYPVPSRSREGFFKVYRLGAVLAYNLMSFDTKEMGREKLLDLVPKLEGGSDLLLCFGEIDCRCHIIKQAEKQKRPVDAIVDDCADNYFKVVDELLASGFSVIIWGVIPSAESTNKEYPTYGSMVERNNCSHKFNMALEQRCKARQIKFVSIFDRLVDKSNRTRIEYYFDAIHLGQAAMPLAIEEFRRNAVEIDVESHGRMYSQYMKLKIICQLAIKKCRRMLLSKSLYPTIL